MYLYICTYVHVCIHDVSTKVWKNIKAPRWSVLCKGEVLPLPASMGNSDMFVATHEATGSRYFARMVSRLHAPSLRVCVCVCVCVYVYVDISIYVYI